MKNTKRCINEESYGAFKLFLREKPEEIKHKKMAALVRQPSVFISVKTKKDSMQL
jgi:hypothetical protein